MYAAHWACEGIPNNAVLDVEDCASWSIQCHHPVQHDSVREQQHAPGASLTTRASCGCQEKDYIVNEARRKFSENKRVDEETVDILVRVALTECC